MTTFKLATIMGHRNPVMTLKRYTRLSPEYMRAQCTVIDRAVRGGKRWTPNGR
jgi:hypothetical protein